MRKKFELKLLLREIQVQQAIRRGREKVTDVLTAKRGDGYIPDAMRILIACVLGALLLAALVFVFKTIVLPRTEDNINNSFNVASSSLT